VVIALGASSLAAPFATIAQQAAKAAGTSASRIWRIGYLGLASRAAGAASYATFVQRMHELGYAEGGNLIIEMRSADGDVPRLTALAAELVQLKVDLIIMSRNPTWAR
jgi:putative ABC transport system substrate-binding protein